MPAPPRDAPEPAHQPLWAVILAGGVGARFWPLSRASRPKQLLDLFGHGAMLRVTSERVAPLAPAERQLVVTGEVLRDPISELLPGVELLAEPVGRNTAPAIAWAALTVAQRDPDAILAVLPADHHVADIAAYRAACAHAAQVAAQGRIVTLGIRPTRPETGYGYIAQGAPIDEGVYAVAAFREKPDLATAATYLADGGYLWNAGMFFFPAALILDELRRFEPEMVSALEDLVAGRAALSEVYPALRSISVDYAVAERSDKVAVIPATFGWSDVGSWSSLHDHRPKDAPSFHQGRVVELDGGGNVLLAADGGTVATVGVRDLVVVHTADATLVCPRAEAQRVREVVEALRARGAEELLR